MQRELLNLPILNISDDMILMLQGQPNELPGDASSFHVHDASKTTEATEKTVIKLDSSNDNKVLVVFSNKGINKDEGSNTCKSDNAFQIMSYIETSELIDACHHTLGQTTSLLPFMFHNTSFPDSNFSILSNLLKFNKNIDIHDCISAKDASKKPYSQFCRVERKEQTGPLLLFIHQSGIDKYFIKQHIPKAPTNTSIHDAIVEDMNGAFEGVSQQMNTKDEISNSELAYWLNKHPPINPLSEEKLLSAYIIDDSKSKSILQLNDESDDSIPVIKLNEAVQPLSGGVQFPHRFQYVPFFGVSNLTSTTDYTKLKSNIISTDLTVSLVLNTLYKSNIYWFYYWEPNHGVKYTLLVRFNFQNRYLSVQHCFYSIYIYNIITCFNFSTFRFPKRYFYNT